MSHGHAPRAPQPVPGAMGPGDTFPVKVSQWQCMVRVLQTGSARTVFGLALPTKTKGHEERIHINKPLDQITWGAAILRVRSWLNGTPGAVMPCINPGCGAPRWGHGMSDGRCEDCRSNGFSGRVDELQKGRAAKDPIEDAAALQMGYKFKTVAHVHPPVGRTYQLIWHTIEPLYATAIQAVLEAEGSLITSDWKQEPL